MTIRSYPTKWIFLAALLLVVMACSSAPTATKGTAAIPSPSPTNNAADPTPKAAPPTEPAATPMIAPTSTPKPSPTPSPTPTGPLAMLKDTSFKLELAISSLEKAKGLGSRNNLPEDTGMLFVYASESNRAFWMKGMEFSIDIIWLSKEGAIIDISKEAAPQPGVSDSDLELYRPRDPAQYVLEINAGLSNRYGFQRGDRFTFHALPASIPLRAGP